MNETTSLLTCRDLAIGYTNRKQARHVIAERLQLDLRAGQLVCLLGPNGAGKSTLMRTLAGLQAPLAGNVRVGGQEVASLSPVELARRLSLVLSERIEAGNLLVRELVALGRTPHTGWLGKLTASDQGAIQRALTATNTLDFAERRLHQLSDGERQKVMLARALAQDTDLILLDEPTAHLDLPSRVELMQLLHRLSRQTQKAILVSTHELDLALQAADTLWLLDAKGNMATGTPEDLVLTGAFEATFFKEGFSFDRTTGTFTLHSDEQGPALRLVGDDSLMFWTRRALQRESFRVTSSTEAIGTVEVTSQAGVPRWLYQQDNVVQQFDSVKALLASLKTQAQITPNALKGASVENIQAESPSGGWG